MQLVKAYIGVGSNLGDPLQQVTDVVPRLGQIPHCKLLASSSLYRTQPIGGVEQEDFINAVACLNTKLTPIELLLELQAIEQAFYRQRQVGQKWGPRTMDLDILLYDQLQMNDSHLTIPHREMQKRLFVLKPLKEIAGDLYIPRLGSLQFLIQHAPPMRIRRIE